MKKLIEKVSSWWYDATARESFIFVIGAIAIVVVVIYNVITNI